MKRQHIWPFAGGSLMAVGSFLPWIESDTYSIAGISGDGIFTLIGGVIVVTLALTGNEGLVPGLLVLLPGFFGGFIVGERFRSLTPAGVEATFDGGVHSGFGLFVAGMGSLIATLASIDLIRPKPKRIQKASPYR